VLVVVHASGKMRLYGMDSKEPTVKFEKQVNPVSSVGWVDAASGEFLSST
jgi:hypothetical protein